MKKLYMFSRLSIIASFSITMSIAPSVYGQHDHTEHATDSAMVAHTAMHFYEAVATGDSAGVADLLAPDVRIMEGGGIETREEYLSHHFHSDAAFLAAMTREELFRKINIEGNTAWISSMSRMHGTYGERAIDLNSAELMVMRKTTDGWRIAAIHWSSRNR